LRPNQKGDIKMPTIAIDTRTNTRVKATRELDIEGLPNETFICPNPHCGTALRIKGNDLAPSRLEEMKKKESLEKKEIKNKKKAHWFHLKAEEGVYKYQEDTTASICGTESIQNFLQLNGNFIEIWFGGDNPENTLSLDLIYNFEGNQYGLEIKHDILKIEEYERREKAYPLYDLVPIWILHKQEMHKIISDSNEEMTGNFGKETKKYNKPNAFNLTSQLERRLARRQEWMLYYEFVPNTSIEKDGIQVPAVDINNPSITITALKLKKRYGKKYGYEQVERYDITTIEEFQYILSQIKLRKDKYEQLRESSEFNEENHYAFDEEKEEWFVQTIMHKCAVSGSPVFFPPDFQVPSNYVIPSVKEREFAERRANGEVILESEVKAYDYVDDHRWSD
jgi:hypothetical protein